MEKVDKKHKDDESLSISLGVGENYYRAVFQSSNNAFFIHDGDLNIKYLNTTALEVLGYENQEELLDKPFLSIFCEQDRERARATGEMRKNGEIPWNEKVEYCLLKKDGSEVYVEMSSAPLFSPKGEIIGWLANFADITQKKKNLDEIKKSSQRLRMILEVTSDGVWERDFRTGEIYYSDTWKKILGYEPDEFPDTHEAWEARIFPEDKQRVLDSLYLVLGGKVKSFHQEYRMIAKSGDIRWILSRGGVTEWISDGVPAKIIGTHEDITERKYVEETLALERDMFSKGPVVFSRWNMNENLEGKLEFVSKNFEQYGYLIEDFYSGRRGYFEIIHEDDRERVIEESIRYLKSGLTQFSSHFRLVQPDGEIRWMRNYVYVDRAKDGGVAGFFQYLLDVSELEFAEKAYRDLVEHSLQGILVAQKNKIIFYNEAAQNMLGYTIEELNQLSIEGQINLIYAEDREIIREILLFKDDSLAIIPRREDIRIYRKDGQLRWFDISLKGIIYRGSYAFQVVCLDITDRKNAELQIKYKLENERNLLEVKSNFISMTSHEFRTPLSEIISSAELLKYYGKEWHEEKRLAQLEKILEAAENMNNMLEEILFLGRIESGRLPNSPEAFCVVEECKIIIEELKFIKGNLNSIKLISSPEKKIYGTFDKTLFKRCLENILSNALKFSSSNGEIVVECQQNSDGISISISDHGIGISKQDLARISEPFFRAKNAENYPGSGLGLTIVVKTLEFIGGKLFIESELGYGSTFRMVFPNQVGNSLIEPE